MRINSVLDPFNVVMLCWAVFAAVFLFQKGPPTGAESRRDRTAFWPIAIQGVAYAIVWIMRRRPETPLFTSGSNSAFGFVAVALAIASVWWVTVSVRTLGKQWAIAARLVEGHKLITNGTYGIVRNPIYAGMLGMLISTGLVVSSWKGLAIGIVLFLIGTRWRVLVEERLLRAQFGGEFEQYCKRVPTLIPGVW